MAQATAEKTTQAGGGPPPGMANLTPEGFGSWSGYEGREADLAKSINMVLRTLKVTQPYPHETNDALVKMHLTAVQFAKNRGLLTEFVEHDVKTLEPLNKRVGALIARSGNREFALVGLCERTGCHYQLVLDTEITPGRRRWKSPFGNVLAAAKRLGQFDLTEQEIHEQWVRPRLLGYARDMGVKIRVSDWNDDGIVTVELAD